MDKQKTKIADNLSKLAILAMDLDTDSLESKLVINGQEITMTFTVEVKNIEP